MIRLLGVLLEWARGIPRARTSVALAIVTGLVAGAATSALVAVINQAISGGSSPIPSLSLGWLFVLLCVIVPVSGITSQLVVIRLTQRAASALRMRLARRVLVAPYHQLEELGGPRLFAVFTDDIANVTAAVGTLPVVIMQLGIIAASLAYLGWLSPLLLAAVVLYMSLGILSHAIPTRHSLRHFKRLRKHWDRVLGAFHGLTGGAKELKLNRERRRVFLEEELSPAVEAIRHDGVWANSLASAAGNWGQILFFIFIGLVAFAALPNVTLDPRATTGCALTILFMVTPLTIILNTLPTFSRAHVAAETVSALGLSLESMPAERVSAASARTWSRLELASVTYAYHPPGTGETFGVGPLDLVLVPGELVFVIGGNGSGKTTLAKLLTGLYEPTSGEILLDGRSITAANRDDYRQLFATVFSDFHLFDRLLGTEDPNVVEQAARYLERLQLDRKVEIVNGRLSTLALSQGQRKRLALLFAYLENRPIYVFDEWTADQDPQFRELFYRRLLPELRARSQTVLVITHDDRYFDVADRVIKLEQGRIERIGDHVSKLPLLPLRIVASPQKDQL